MQLITCVCHEPYGYADPLIYTVQVKNPQDYDEVLKAVEKEREKDLGYKPDGLEILCAFDGDISPIADWRD